MDSETTNKYLNYFKSNTKILILISISIFIILILFYWKNHYERQNAISVSDSYIKAKILISQNKESEAANELEAILNKKSNIYSPLALFLIIDKKLEKDENKIEEYFDIVLSINKINDEDLNLLKLKKTIYFSSKLNEEEILNLLNPVVNSNSIWKVQSLKFLGDYYFSKKEFNKAEQYYMKIIGFNDQNIDLGELNRKIKIIKKNG